jgi:hypothetical protein
MLDLGEIEISGVVPEVMAELQQSLNRYLFYC